MSYFRHDGDGCSEHPAAVCHEHAAADEDAGEGGCHPVGGSGSKEHPADCQQVEVLLSSQMKEHNNLSSVDVLARGVTKLEGVSMSDTQLQQVINSPYHLYMQIFCMKTEKRLQQQKMKALLCLSASPLF